MEDQKGLVNRGPPRLVPDVLDEVFASLHLPGEWDHGAHKSDLYSCCLVSRDWCDAARPHLFHVIHIRFHDCHSPEHESLCKTGSASRRRGDSPWSSLSAFQHFLSSYPRLAIYIRRLCLTRMLAPGPRNHVCVELLQSVVELLPRLQHLTVAGITLSARPNQRCSHLAIQSVHITTPPVDGIDFDLRVGDVLGFVDMFCEVRSLFLLVNVVDSLSWVPSHRRIPPVPSTTEVASITVASSRLRPVFEMIGRAMDTSRLTSLHLPSSCIHHMYLERDDTGAQELLSRRIGAQLLDLGVCVDPSTFVNFPDPAVFIRLIAMCGSLTSVTLTCDLMLDAGRESTDMPNFALHCATPTELAQYVPAIPISVTRVVLEVFVWGSQTTPVSSHGNEASGRLALEDTIVNRFGPDLPMVHIRPLRLGYLIPYKPHVLQILADTFPRLAAAGRLHIEGPAESEALSS